MLSNSSLAKEKDNTIIRVRGVSNPRNTDSPKCLTWIQRFLWNFLYRDIQKSADFTSQELYWSFFLCKDLKSPLPPNCTAWIKYWKCFEQTKILFKHLLPVVFAFIASLTNQFRRGMLMVTVLWSVLYLLSQMAFQLIFPPWS